MLYSGLFKREDIMLSNKKLCFGLKCSYCGRFMSFEDLRNGRSSYTMTYSNTGGEEYEGECKLCKEKAKRTTPEEIIKLIETIAENEVDPEASLYRKGWSRGWNAFREELHYILERNRK